MMRRIILSVFCMVLLPALLQAQTGIIRGKITSETDEPLLGANVMVVNTSIGASTDDQGVFTISDVPEGPANLKVTFIGYSEKVIRVTIKSDQTITVNVSLEEQVLEGQEITVLANRAKVRETPVAFADVKKADIEAKLASRDIPLILNTTPGVYATASGGGAGDARISIRGFDQRNTAVMVNGVPVNDMENGWVYWSNWDGLGDVTSSIQVQRGLSAANLSVSSVGGIMNVITDAASFKRGAKFKQELGDDGFMKSTFVANTGLINNKFAFTFAGVRKLGDGMVDKTWSDAWAYFAAISYDLNKNHKLDFFWVGAPQSHGQRTTKKTIVTYDSEYAREQGVSDSIIQATKVKDQGTNYNPHWGYINDTRGTMTDYYNGSTQDMHDKSYVLEKENYFHKPQGNLNWYWKVNEKLNLTNVFYLSIAKGGGSGAYLGYLGKYAQTISDPTNTNYGLLDFQSVYDSNCVYNAKGDTVFSSDATVSRARSILRNSVNQHFWYGWVGTADYKINDAVKLTGGGDFRFYTANHWQEIRNMVGGDYFIDASYNSKTKAFTSYDQTRDYKSKLYLGDKISYNNDGIVRQLGGFLTAEYKTALIGAYINTSLSQTSYKRKDYFVDEALAYNIANGIKRETEWENFTGFTVKTGTNFNITSSVNAYINAGYLSKAPLFQPVFNNINKATKDIKNETIIAFEMGSGYNTRLISVNANVYFTDWKDKTYRRNYSLFDSTYQQSIVYNYLLTGIDARHLGFELEATSRPTKYLKLDAMVSLGNWKWQNNVSTWVYDDEHSQAVDSAFIFIKGLKVGDAAQTTMAFTATAYPYKGVYVSGIYKYFADNYSFFSPETRNKEGDAHPWKLPNYGLMDLHAGYTLPFSISYLAKIQINLNIFNVLDELYISDADDGSKHDASTANVYFGLPRQWNAGIILSFY